MIRDDHQACLAGLMTVISDSPSNYVITTVETGGTIRWMAPELLDPERFGFDHDHCSPSRQSDLYAFGMVIYEVCVLGYLFHKIKLTIIGPDWGNSIW
jgi:serine/threonine protein kinase